MEIESAAIAAINKGQPTPTPTPMPIFVGPSSPPSVAAKVVDVNDVSVDNMLVVVLLLEIEVEVKVDVDFVSAGSSIINPRLCNFPST